MHDCLCRIRDTLFNKYKSTRHPVPGALGCAFQGPMLSHEWFVGRATLTNGQIYLTAAQVFVQQQTVPTGIAGIGAGQLRSGSLSANG